MYLSCYSCGEIFSTKNALNDHKNDCNETPFEMQKMKECIFFKRGRCNKGEQCLFKHTNSRSKSSSPQCRYGLRCFRFALGQCRFVHPQNTPPPQPNHNGSQRQREVRYCRYGAACRFLPNCIFFHYDQDFPLLRRRMNPPIRGQPQLNPWMMK